MQTVNVEDVRHDFGPVEDWLGRGESVELRRDGREFARIVPAAASKPASGNGVQNRPPVPKPDFMKRLKETWGDRVFTDEEVRRMREDELEGEEG